MNLIDTPGHSDFSFEVQKTLLACEGALLLVDATKGIQAQTVANFNKATELGMTILPVINKIGKILIFFVKFKCFSRNFSKDLDLNGADVEKTREEIKNVLNLDPSRSVAISAKMGLNISRLLRQIVKILPPPKSPAFTFNSPETSSSNVRKQKEKFLYRVPNPTSFRAYIFDSWFEKNKGCYLMIRMYNGQISVGSFLEISSFPEEIFQISELGVFSPNRELRNDLFEGEVGFVACNLKKPKMGIEALGGSLLSLHKGLDSLAKPKLVKPVVFASVFPDSPDESDLLDDCVQKILLEDPAITCERDSSIALGNGFRCGFLGELHLEIFQQRIFDEFGLKTIVTPASVVYEVMVLILSFYSIEVPNREN